jgi:uncharacterized membrane protein YpjA
MTNLIENLRPLSRKVMLEIDGLFWLWMAINIVGFVLGTAGWYGGQLAVTPLIWWIFVPDCPLVAGYAAAALWGLRKGRRWTAFNLFTALGCIKYGVWTCLVWLLYWSNTGDFQILSIPFLMFVTHLGLIAQGIVILILTERWSVREVLPAVAYYAAADFVDYGLGHHPSYPMLYVSPAIVQWHSVAMTWLLSGLLLWLGWRMEQRTARPSTPTSIEAAQP